MTQLDLFGERQSALDREVTRKAERAAEAARAAAYLESLKIDCCTGEPIPRSRHGSEQYRCGRCGALAVAGSYPFNHDRGWSGCYADTEPTRGTGQRLNNAEVLSATRHDDQHHPRCAYPDCGHARGFHQGGVWPTAPEDASCYGCPCPGYVAPTEQVVPGDHRVAPSAPGKNDRNPTVG